MEGRDANQATIKEEERDYNEVTPASNEGFTIKEDYRVRA